MLAFFFFLPLLVYRVKKLTFLSSLAIIQCLRDEKKPMIDSSGPSLKGEPELVIRDKKTMIDRIDQNLPISGWKMDLS